MGIEVVFKLHRRQILRCHVRRAGACSFELTARCCAKEDRVNKTEVDSGQMKWVGMLLPIYRCLLSLKECW
jgi:hypothetical protein